MQISRLRSRYLVCIAFLLETVLLTHVLLMYNSECVCDGQVGSAALGAVSSQLTTKNKSTTPAQRSSKSVISHIANTPKSSTPRPTPSPPLPLGQSTITSQNSSADILDVCPELYVGVTTENSQHTGGRDIPLDEHGWEFEECVNARKLESIVTVFLNGMRYTNDQVQTVIEQIHAHYPLLKILLAVGKSRMGNDLVNSTNVEKVSTDETNVWKELTAASPTKYSLVLRDVFRFTNYTRVERLVSAAFRLNIPVVGGASVGFNGHWWNNCYQIRIRNYVLRYKYGYTQSTDSCLFCDHITGPFLVRTDFLKSALAGLPKESDIFFEAMFLNEKIRNKSKFLVCPDVMFHVDDIALEKQDSKSRWLPIAKSQELTKLVTFSNTFEFGCAELGIKCPRLVKGMTNAPCCQQLYSTCLRKTSQFAYKYNILTEVRCGSLLGVLKTGSILPWEVDIDMHYYAGNHSHIPKLRESLIPFDCIIEDPDKIRMGSGTISVSSQGAEFTRMALVPSLLYRQRTGYNNTFVQLDREWVQSPPSPGLASRNNYREEIYKHVPHIVQGGKIYSSTGFFPPCPHPGHHNCVDNFAIDGNLQFTEN